MRDFITVRVLSIGELFSGEFAFRLPWFQRAYAWQPTEVARLMRDLLDAQALTGEHRRYFLGNIMLAKEPGSTDTALVDGHQRVMTLTILFAVLRDIETDQAQKLALQKLIGDGPYILTSQEMLRDFIETYVQKPGATTQELDENPSVLSETERNVIDNRDYLVAKLDHRDIPKPKLRELLRFLTESCFVSVSIVHDENEAWKFLQIEEDTHHRFSLTNRAKSTLLGIVPMREREECRRIWELAEEKLGSEDMFNLLGYLRLLLTRKPSDKPLDTELSQIGAFKTNGLAFMKTVLEPAALRLHLLRRLETGVPGDKPRLATSVEQLSWIAPHSWLPVGMLWLEKNGSSRDTVKFFVRLERLMWMMRLAGVDPAQQQKKLLKLLGSIDKGLTAGDIPELEISKEIRDDALASLRAPTFDARRYAGRVLRRIAAHIGNDPGPIHSTNCTIEHILPCGFLEKSGWRHDFKSSKVVKSYSHRLGNLTFLTGEQNNLADSKDWDAKRAIYETCDFEITRELISVERWDQKAIDARTERLIRLLFDAWELPV